MRVAYLSPMPPEKSGIADYSYELLEALGELIDVTVFVTDENVPDGYAPEGIEIEPVSALQVVRYDGIVYQMGNNSRYHRFVFERSQEDPGLLVLHDPSLLDFHTEICGGTSGSIFRNEVAFDRPELQEREKLPTVDVGRGKRNLDRLEILLARRLVEANRRTLVNSQAMAELLSQRYAKVDVHAIRLPARLGAERAQTDEVRQDGILFGVFGGINHYKRVLSALHSFLGVHERFPGSRMVIAGRPDDVELTAHCRSLAEGALRGVLRVETELSLAGLEAEMAACDVAIQLRWPTAGETSATLMRCFALGTPSIVSDVPQFKEFDPVFCWAVPTDGRQEERRLAELMLRLAENPGRARSAGVRARGFVESCATYEKVAAEYVHHLEECSDVAPRRRSLRLERRPGINVVIDTTASREVRGAAVRAAALLSRAGVDVATEDVEGGQQLLAASYRPTSVVDPNSSGTSPAEHVAAPTRRPYLASLITVDGVQSPDLGRWIDAEHRRRGSMVIGLFAPTTTSIEGATAELLGKLDDVWVPTGFAAAVVQPHARRPVFRVPLLGSTERLGQRVPRTWCSFLSLVNGSGHLARQNPRAAVAAFRRAFSARERGRLARLTIGVEDASPQLTKGLRDLGAEVGAEVVSIDGDAAREELLSECDVYVALHRSDPYGENLLRALELGRLVVATDGFGTPEQFDLRGTWRAKTRVSAASDVEIHGWSWVPDAGRLSGDWGDPDLDHAAQLLRRTALEFEGADRRVPTRPGLAESSVIARLEEVAHRPLAHRTE